MDYIYFKNRFFLVVIVFLLVGLSCDAQPYFDVVSVQTSTANHSLTNYTGKEKISLNWFCANLSFPVKINRSNLLVTTVGYEQFQFEGNGNPLTQNFNSIYLPLTVLHTWKDTTWNTSFTLIPKVNSYSPLEVNNNTFQAGGAIIATHTISSKFKYSFGGYYNREFFGDYFLPLLGLEWKASERLHVFGLLPNDFTADYRIKKAWHGGLVYKGVTTSFRYKSTALTDYLRMEEGQLKLFSDLYIKKTIALNLEAGIIVARSYGLKYYDQPQLYDFSVRESGIFKIGLIYRVWL